MEKYCRIKEEFWKQNKVKLRKIAKEPREELVEQGKKKARKILYEKLQVLPVSRVSLSFHLKHEALSHYSTWIMVYEDNKIDLKFASIINFTTQGFSESIVYQLVTIHYCVFLKAFLSQFPYYIIHKLLIIHFFINYLLPLTFIQIFIHIEPSALKIISLYLIMACLMTIH